MHARRLEKLQLLERAECGRTVRTTIQPRALCKRYWVLKNFDIAIPPELLLSTVDNATRMLFEKQGQRPPRWLRQAGVTDVATD